MLCMQTHVKKFIFFSFFRQQVDFFWINRDQKSFEWFVKLLSQLEIEQSEQDGVMGHFLDMHMYITSALQKTDMKAVGLQLALDLLHEKVYTARNSWARDKILLGLIVYILYYPEE